MRTAPIPYTTSAAVQTVSLAPGDRVEHEDRPALAAGQTLDRRQESARDAAPARLAVHEELGDLGAVPCVREQCQPQLGGADDAISFARNEQNHPSGLDFGGDRSPPGGSLAREERRNETDGCSAVDRVHEQARQALDQTVE